MPTTDLHVPGDIHGQLFADVTQACEWAGYLLCGARTDGDHTVLLGREWHPVPTDMEVRGSGHGFSWQADFDVEMLNRAQRESLACVVLHYHGGTQPRLGHNSDRPTADSLMPFLSKEAAGRPHVFGVLGDHAASGIVFREGVEVGALTSYRVSSRRLDDWSTTSSRTRATPLSTRHDRLVRGFGAGARYRLAEASVGVVGCGGGGSHVVQQLAYLGVGRLVLVDADLVEETNLNRLIGATPGAPNRSFLDRLTHRGKSDVGRSKVDVMKRLVTDIDHTIGVEVHQEAFPSTATVRALRSVDILVSCVDRLQVRDHLNKLAKRYLIPMIDVGIEIAPGEVGSERVLAIVGRVTKVLADGPCLRCQDIVNDERLAGERSGRPLGYAGDPRLPDPAVVTLNGVVASLAATEVLQLVTGFGGKDAPNCGWIYDGVLGTTQAAVKRYVPDRDCEVDRGRGDP